MLDSVRFYLSYDIKITLKSHFFEISNQLELFPYSPILFKPFWFGRFHIFVYRMLGQFMALDICKSRSHYYRICPKWLL